MSAPREGYDVSSDVLRDARRYRFLRDVDNWGEDSGEASWEALGESSMSEFDALVDLRMSQED